MASPLDMVAQATRSAHRAFWGAAVASLLLAGCSSAAKPQAPRSTVDSSAPGVSADPEALPSLEEATAAFEQAELELAEAFPRPEPRRAPAAPAPRSEMPEAAAEPPGLDRDVGATPLRAGEDRCSLACKALGSMRRAAEEVCGITGEDDPRCGDVRGRVDSAAERVRESCPGCAAG